MRRNFSLAPNGVVLSGGLFNGGLCKARIDGQGGRLEGSRFWFRSGCRGCRRLGGNVADENRGRAASFIDVHEFANEGLGVQVDTFGIEAHEASSVDWRSDAMEVFILDVVDDLDENAGLGGHLRLGEALGFARLAESLSE